MTERRVIVSLARDQVESAIRVLTLANWVGVIGRTTAENISATITELRSALAVYDLTRDTITRLAAVPNLDAASLTEHDVSSAEVW